MRLRRLFRRDGIAWYSPELRLIKRGGSWGIGRRGGHLDLNEPALRAAYRYYNYPHWAGTSIGIRLSRSVGGKDET
jgi:hypothetical protein